MSKSSAAAALAKLLDMHGGQQADNLDVAMTCKVLTFDPVALVADVQPLVQTGDEAPAPLLEVPVTGLRVLFGGAETVLRPALHVGDTVLVVCCDAEIQNTLSGQVAAPDTARRHSRNDAVVIGVMPCCL
ncbi:hypothetical protein KIH86_03690 [Paenibacillus sp. HN-1]|uniref:Gp138 family membrane-puncturing spike protein n=2 Tax=Paenibacillus TaxID=44249 RepID=UPI001CA94D8F|nr:Gp138 family membrane-puncturing spike protein [Paenibacillus sp. CGMCC 1.18879]MBY9077285.1 hypothetical protein [Paenibacillus sp. CGMCC 1.18879]MBY9083332.1 hypothetical protein [Paenibacillus sinensis]